MLEKIKAPWYKYLILFLIGFAFILIRVGLSNAWNLLLFYMDGAYIGGAILILLGALSVVTNQGAFNIFSYMGSKLSKDGRKLTYGEYAELKAEQRTSKRWYFFPYLLTGVFYILVGTILLIVSNYI